MLGQSLGYAWMMHDRTIDLLWSSSIELPDILVDSFDMSGTLISFNGCCDCGTLKRLPVTWDYKVCFPVISKVEWEPCCHKIGLSLPIKLGNVSWPLEEGEFRKYVAAFKCIT